MNSPATGLHMVASAVITVAVASRELWPRVTRPDGNSSTVATRPNSTPSANVTRPETMSHQRANTVHITGISGRFTPDRSTSAAANPADRVPATTAVVRTPSAAMTYGDRMLYEAGCIPPYQDRLYEADG